MQQPPRLGSITALKIPPYSMQGHEGNASIQLQLRFCVLSELQERQHLRNTRTHIYLCVHTHTDTQSRYTHIYTHVYNTSKWARRSQVKGASAQQRGDRGFHGEGYCLACMDTLLDSKRSVSREARVRKYSAWAKGMYEEDSNRCSETLHHQRSRKKIAQPPCRSKHFRFSVHIIAATNTHSRPRQSLKTHRNMKSSCAACSSL